MMDEKDDRKGGDGAVVKTQALMWESQVKFSLQHIHQCVPEQDTSLLAAPEACDLWDI